MLFAPNKDRACHKCLGLSHYFLLNKSRFTVRDRFKETLISRVKLFHCQTQNSTKNQKYTHVNFTATFYSSFHILKKWCFTDDTTLSVAVRLFLSQSPQATRPKWCRVDSDLLRKLMSHWRIFQLNLGKWVSSWLGDLSKCRETPVHRHSLGCW